MPVVEPTPHARKRVLVRRGTLHSISSDDESPKSSTVKPPPPQALRKSGSLSPLTRSFSSLDQVTDDASALMNKLESTKLNLAHSQSVEEEVNDILDSETFHGRPKSFTLPPGVLRRQVHFFNSQHEESGDSERRSSAGSVNSDGEPRRLSSICPPDLSTISEAKEIEQTPNDIAATSAEDDDNFAPFLREKKNSSSLDKINDFRSGRQYSIYNKFTKPDLNYDLEEYETIAPDMLQEVLVWDFSIDQLEKVSNGFILSRVSDTLCKISILFNICILLTIDGILPFP